MTALADDRAVRIKRFQTFRLAATASDTYYKNAVVCFDTSTGLVTVAKVSTTLIPIGLVAEQVTLGGGGGSIDVVLFREIVGVWLKNSAGADEVLAASIGGLAYFVDDQTVADNDDTNARSVAGRVWAIDAVKGVLVESLDTAGDATVSGLD